jgi:predicted  nucleic acid-binding Zn-ribbon protein
MSDYDLVQQARDFSRRMLDGHAAAFVSKLCQELDSSRSAIERLQAERNDYRSAAEDAWSRVQSLDDDLAAANAELCHHQTTSDYEMGAIHANAAEAKEIESLRADLAAANEEIALLRGDDTGADARASYWQARCHALERDRARIEADQ